MMGVCRLIRIWCRLFIGRSWDELGEGSSVLFPNSTFIKKSIADHFEGAAVSANN